MGMLLDEQHLSYLLSMIEKDEGYRPVPYRDTKNILTVGYGRNLQARPLDLFDVVKLFNLANDLSQSNDLLQNRTKKVKKFFDELLARDVSFFMWGIVENFKMYIPILSQERRIVLINMAYNMGIKSLKEFRSMFAAIKERNWDKSSQEILNSDAANSLPDRYKRLAEIMKSNVLP